ncbi:MAG: EFR1 family ferrodoxin [Bacteroidales bacterium]|nr:EFR1 family ferrodoxin [Bacteroidales bacterium]
MDYTKKRIILYFTATGNSLYIARELADENTELLSIPQLVRENRYDFEANEIGIVYPIYGHMPPNMVRRFIEKANLKADYKFAVLTFGARKCDAVEIFDGITETVGMKFDYISTIMMVDNWLPHFDMDEQRKLDKHIPEHLSDIISDINTHKKWHQPVSNDERQLHRNFLGWSGIDQEVGFMKRSEEFFSITDKCVKCEICTKVCPKGNYTLTGNVISTYGDCEFCFACIQNCPQKAIQFIRQKEGVFPDGTEPNPNARYRNPDVTIKDIILSNNQEKTNL